MTNAQNDPLMAYGAGNMEAAFKAFGTVSTGIQTLASELADYNKTSIERTAAAFQDLARAKSFGEAMQIQSNYLRASYENLSAEMNKIGEIWLSIAGEGRDLALGKSANARKARAAE